MASVAFYFDDTWNIEYVLSISTSVAEHYTGDAGHLVTYQDWCTCRYIELISPVMPIYYGQSDF